MKKAILLIALGLLLSANAYAGGFDIKRATGVCKANNSNLDFNLDTYNKTFINIKVRIWDEKKDVEGKEGDWEKTMYFLMDAWSKGMEECAGGNKEVCKIIIEHTKYLADNNGLKRGYSWKDYDHVFEATFFNNHAAGHVLAAYGIAIQQINIDSDVHKAIGKWAKKIVKSNNNLNKGTWKYTNHHLNYVRALALYGGIWKDTKSLNKAKKVVLSIMKSITKEGALRLEAVRGVRGLYYHGKTLHGLFITTDILYDAGINLYTDKFNEDMNRAVNFYLDASLDNMLIYPWAKIKRHNKMGDPKIQEQTHYQNGWAPAFLYHYKDLYPDTIEKTKANPYIQKFVKKNLRSDVGSGMWGLIDSKCIYPIPVFKMKIQESQSKFKYRAIVKNKIDSSILIKVEGPTKETAEKEAMKICINKSIQSSFKDACYVHYSGDLGRGY